MPKMKDGSLDYGEFVPHTETWKAMEECVRLGMTKHIGLSNFNEDQIGNILKNCTIRPTVLQCEGHPYLAQNALRTFCEEQKIVLEAYSPLGNPGRPKGWDHSLKRVLDDGEIKAIADELGVTVADCCIRYQLERGVVVIPKSVTPHRIKSNFEVWGFELGADRMKRMAALDANQRYCVPSKLGADGKRVLQYEGHPFWPFGQIKFEE